MQTDEMVSAVRTSTDLDGAGARYALRATLTVLGQRVADDWQDLTHADPSRQ